MLWLLLFAQVILVTPPHLEDKDFQQWFDRAKVGESYAYITPAGDGCNTCGGTVFKVSESEVRDMNIRSCTLLACLVGTIFKVK